MTYKLNKKVEELFFERFKDFHPIQKIAIPEILNGKYYVIGHHHFAKSISTSIGESIYEKVL